MGRAVQPKPHNCKEEGVRRYAGAAEDPWDV